VSDFAFVVFLLMPPPATEPAECPFHDPAPGLDLETLFWAWRGF